MSYVIVYLPTSKIVKPIFKNVDWEFVSEEEAQHAISEKRILQGINDECDDNSSYDMFLNSRPLTDPKHPVPEHLLEVIEVQDV
jgi:hypothetical protein